jgi:hydroxyethylthiazole kinase
MGGLPIMASAKEEVEEIVSKASVLLLNIGTPTSEQLEAMELAGSKAKELKIPIVFDPVGAGASRFRTKAAMELIQTLQPSAVRSTLAEALSLLQEDARILGVESLEDDEETAKRAARELATRFGCVAAITGKVDIVSDGEHLESIAGGNPLLKSITGSGCMATAAVACFLAKKAPMKAAVLGLSLMKTASELALEVKGPGSFQAALLDAVYRLREGL